ncbi:Transglutaminase-like superfamily protein [Butyrivibrio sp. ob235]|uniref:transglutaminase domain-containing protein n=1 Tax=Butyrivibrio sp. ob235 TaxID=1761780 RepID=UPI0008C2EC06|nr:transglutaminase domain-containing protein [Butyrivibrio sp. ob235]SEK68827.1 Transglutaminase-like superfamily protein [Butyrivibrio sp. ob235]
MKNDSYNFTNNSINPNHEDKKSQKHSHLPLIILALFLVIGLCLGYRMMQSDTSGIFSLPANVIFSLRSTNGKTLNYDAPIVPEERDEIFVLYQNLSDADKNVYNLFMDLVENRSAEEYESAIVFSKDTLEEFGEDRLLWDIYYAMCYDHPEYFFLFTDTSAVDYRTLEMRNHIIYFIKIEVVDPSENEQIAAFEEAASDFLDDIDLTGTDEEIELAIHDKLIDVVTYDDPILNDTDETWDLGHTAYGALVCDSEGRPNHAVCGGYSFAFEYLLHRAGIPCGYVTGAAHSIPSSEYDTDTHAWNAVQISGKWYEVDSTWNDIAYDVSEDPQFYNALLSDDEKVFNVCHHYYNRTTAEMQNLEATDDTLFCIEGYEPYNAVYDTSHIRAGLSDHESDQLDIFLNSLIPIAE